MYPDAFEYEQTLAHYMNVQGALMHRCKRIPRNLLHTYLVFQESTTFARAYRPKDFRLITKDSKDHLQCFLNHNVLLHGTLVQLLDKIPRNRASLYRWEKELEKCNKLTIIPDVYKIIQVCPYHMKGTTKRDYICVKKPDENCYCSFIVNRVLGSKGFSPRRK